ncbi:zinc ribbon domain-containing protein [Natranaeroarchaeum sulfidigenes]|uniref:zinc ribbon domain-containing protein n=1 Tax=Natranaeroarchaeum sulfidigenes TaxID=2784880 RepID=UPI001EE5AD33|nr:zinc ribbon domain-containing protein [Natranaeroarchaeum sulfidigenes]
MNRAHKRPFRRERGRLVKLWRGINIKDNGLDGLYMVTNQECLKCKTKVAKDAKYCPECGTNLADYSCPNCGVRIEQDPNFCSECGYEIQSDIEEVKKSDHDTNKMDEVTEDITNKDQREAADGTDDSRWDPAFPIFSIFTAIMLIWAGMVQVPRTGEVFFFMLAGVLVIPRVRRRVVPLIHDKTGVDLSWHRDDWEEGPPDRIWSRPFFLIGLAYTLLLLLAVAVSIMETANDPTMSASAGLVMVVFVFVLALVIVYGIRGIRRLTTA